MKKLMVVVTIVILCLSILPASAQSDIVSLGKTYQLITPASSGYPDTSEYKLTNGVYAESETETSYFASPEYVGFNQVAVDENNNFVIVLDLGSEVYDLSRFEISYLNETDIGVFSPASVTFSISDTRNGTYTPIGTQVIDDPVTGGIVQTGKATVIPDGPISGQYIMIVVKRKDSFENEQGQTVSPGWVFLDEISVFGTEGGGDVSEESPDQTQDNSPDVPETGDTVSVIAYIILGLTSLLMVCGIILNRKLDEPK